MKSLTPNQIMQQDAVDNQVLEFVQDLTGKEIEWDIDVIGEVRDGILDTLVKKEVITDDEAKQIYPYTEE